MTLIEGIGDEVTHFFIALFIISIVTLAWWTTNITEQRHTVWILNLRRVQTLNRRLNNELTTLTRSLTITEGTSTTESPSESESLPVTASEEIMAKPPEPSTSAEQTRAEEEEQNRIVETMDAELCMVRQRRLAFYSKNDDDSENQTSTAPAQMSLSETNECSPLDTNLQNQNEHVDDNKKDNNKNQNTSSRDASDITIRLKYINDDLKSVDGNLQELLGHFKSRHFHEELSSNKLVRLIFNGQVLHQDSKTLEGCGLFDNCVVHCLIHQKRPTATDESSTENRTDTSTLSSSRNIPSNNNEGREWDLGNFLFASLTFTLLSAWYFRYVYAHLYTVTATVGLILITGIFSIVLFGFYFPEQEQIPTTQTDNPQQEM